MRLMATILVALALPVAAADNVTPGVNVPADQIRDAFSVSEWNVISLDLPDRAEGALNVVIRMGDQSRTMSLHPHSLRSANFRVLVQDDDGRFVETPAPAPRTMRGSVEGLPNAVVSASIIDGQLFAVIDEGNGTLWGIQPLSARIDGAPHRAHLVYRSDALLPIDGVCGNEDIAELTRGIELGDPGPSAELKETKIGIDADNRYFNLNGRSVPRTIADVENIINRVSTIYERDAELCYKITALIVRSNGDPARYTSNDPFTLLRQFQAEWNANQGGVERATAHMFTGRNLDGNVIGIARGFNLICNRGSSYALSQARFTSNILVRTGLVSHEIGHLWGALHCDGRPSCKIMCSVIGQCARDVTSFGPDSIRSILNHKRTRTCLGRCGGAVPCEAIKKLAAKCKGNGVIKGKVKLFNSDFDGEILLVDVDGNEEEAVINGKKAKFSSFFFDPGRHPVTIIDPPDCGFNKTVRCE